jgi:hypothetical protein
MDLKGCEIEVLHRTSQNHVLHSIIIIIIIIIIMT